MPLFNILQHPWATCLTLIESVLSTDVLDTTAWCNRSPEAKGNMMDLALYVGERPYGFVSLTRLFYKK